MIMCSHSRTSAEPLQKRVNLLFSGTHPFSSTEQRQAREQCGWGLTWLQLLDLGGGYLLQLLHPVNSPRSGCPHELSCSFKYPSIFLCGISVAKTSCSAVYFLELLWISHVFYQVCSSYIRTWLCFGFFYWIQKIVLGVFCFCVRKMPLCPNSRCKNTPLYFCIIYYV